jgi:hypothetical protein
MAYLPNSLFWAKVKIVAIKVAGKRMDFAFMRVREGEQLKEKGYLEKNSVKD